jgi:excisionase family DNA binding protein
MQIQESQSPATFWSKKQTSSYLCCSIKTVERLISNGRIRAFKMGRKVLVYAETVTEQNINSIKPNFNFKSK